jgi:hypothetical protein
MLINRVSFGSRYESDKDASNGFLILGFPFCCLELRRVLVKSLPTPNTLISLYVGSDFDYLFLIIVKLSTLPLILLDVELYILVLRILPGLYSYD